jgi:hypothetical protein
MKKTAQEENAAPEISLIETIGNSDLDDLAIDTGEVLLDQLLQAGIARDLPIIGSVVGLVKFGVSVRDYLFLNKTLRFLYHLKDISLEERRSFSEQLSLDKKLKQQVGENLILVLDRLDNVKKSDFLGRFFNAHITGKIDLQAYEKLATALDRVKVQSLPGLADFYRQFDGKNYKQLQENPTLPRDVIQDLISAGLIDIRFMPGMVIISVDDFETGATKTGKLFVEIALELM